MAELASPAVVALAHDPGAGRVRDPRVVASVALLLGVTVTVMLQGWWKSDSALIGMFIPDAVGYLPVFEEMSLHEDVIASIPEALSGTVGTVLVYYPFWRWHPAAMVIPNVFMLLVAVWAAERALRALGPIPVAYACWFVALNPYFLVGIAGPNKEIILSSLTLLALAVQPSWRSAPLLLLIAVAMASVRIPYALAVLAWVGGQLIWHGRLNKWLLLAPVLVAAAFPLLAEEFQFIRANVVAATAVDTAVGGSQIVRMSLDAMEMPGLSILAFLFRAVANAYAAAVRPAVFGPDGEVALLGTAYFVHGVLLQIGITGVLIVWSLGKSGGAQEGRAASSARDLARYMVYLWLSVSAGLFVSGRYLMPIVPASLAVFGTLRRRTQATALALLVLVDVTAFVLIGLMGVPSLNYEPSAFRPDFFLELR